VLIDVEDVTLGHESRMRWNDTDKWVWSEKLMHEPLVTLEMFETAQAHLAANQKKDRLRHGRTPVHAPYLLRGLLRCSLCQRKMHGSWNHSAARYRCQYAKQYALVNEIDHPKTIYVREDQIVAALDRWIAQVFEPANLQATCQAIQAAQEYSSAEFIKTRRN
jgi:site-specific DNA recombinase